MSKIKIHEIAKKIGVASKEVVTKANEIGISVSSHLSSVEDEEAKKIINAFENKTEKKTTESQNIKTKKQEQDKEKNKDTKKQDAPVIIRREVIINENDEKDANKRKQEERNRNVGFVERNRNDYNIVYRNKPSKPLTVSELFGIKDNKKEEKAKANEQKQEIKPITNEEIKVESNDKDVLKENNSNIKNEIGVRQEKNNMVEEKAEKKVYNQNSYNNKPNNYNKQNSQKNESQLNNRGFNRNYDGKYQNNNYQNNRNGNNARGNFQNNRNDNNTRGNFPNNRNENGYNRYQSNGKFGNNNYSRKNSRTTRHQLSTLENRECPGTPVSLSKPS